MEFCGVDPDLLSVTTNAEPYADYDLENAGFTVAEGTIDKRFSFELWTGLSGRACEPGDEEASGYRSEEHTSELQSLMRISYAVFCLKKTKKQEGKKQKDRDADHSKCNRTMAT